MDIMKMRVRQAVIAVVIMIAAVAFWFAVPLTGRKFDGLEPVLILIFAIGIVTLVDAIRINGPKSIQKEEEKWIRKRSLEGS